MKEQAIFDSIEQEILRNLSARHHKNGFMNMQDIVTEAAFCLAVNNLIAAKQLNIQKMPLETMGISIKGMNMALEKNLKNDYKKEHLKMITDYYEMIISDFNRINLINNHYNELYGFQNGNVL